MGKSRQTFFSTTPPFSIIRGLQEFATYRMQVIPEYIGNPLLEALRPVMTREEVLEGLAYFPPYSEDQRNLPEHVRLQLIENAREFFIPQGIHLEIETKISCMLRRGLMTRNPITWGYWKDFSCRIASMQENSTAQRCGRAKARGFAIIGIGGVGKSTTVENILALYPQVIVHTKYGDQDFILKQLVWLKLDCPRDGSTKSLCENFFLTVDDILGTNYYEHYVGRGRPNTNLLLLYMARVASLHCLGLLIIDEIQDLSAAKSGGVAMMLNFFVNLENIIGVPYILIGTPKARHLFSGEFRQARRASEQGDINWKRMDEKIRRTDQEFSAELRRDAAADDSEYSVNPVWADFVKALWRYQYVKKPSKLGEDLLKDKRVHALYDKSQGIAAVAVTLFLLAQRRAIASGTETITTGLIHSVADDSQSLISSKINELRKGFRYDISTTSDDLDIPFGVDVDKDLDAQSYDAIVDATEITDGKAAFDLSPSLPPANSRSRVNASTPSMTQREPPLAKERSQTKRGPSCHSAHAQKITKTNHSLAKYKRPATEFLKDEKKC